MKDFSFGILPFSFLLVFISCQSNEPEPEMTSGVTEIYTFLDFRLGSDQNSGINTTDENIVLVGSKDNRKYLVKIKENGNVVFETKILIRESKALAVCESDTRHLFVSGFSGEINNNPDTLVVSKLNSKGDVLWSNSYMPEFSLKGQNIQMLNSNEFVILTAGEKQSILSIDSSGNFLELLELSESKLAASNMIVHNGENILITGSDDSNGGLECYDREGNLIWRSILEAQSLVSSIQIDNGDILSVGMIDYHVFVARTNSDGDSIWSLDLQMNSTFRDTAIDIVEDALNGFIITGYSEVESRSPFMLHVDSIGNQVYKEHFTNKDPYKTVGVIKESQNRNIIIGGANSSTFLLNVDNLGFQ